MSGYLEFKTDEFQLIGDVMEIDEQVQRAQNLQFFTLDDQLTDSFERLMPAGHPTKYQLDQLKQEVDRYRDLYETYVVQTPDGYTVQKPFTRRSFDWISPVYKELELQEVNVRESIAPLMETRDVANGYPRLLGAMPHPYATRDGQIYSFSRPTEFVDTEGAYAARALPAFAMSTSRYFDNGKLSIENVPVDGTNDTMTFIGYYLAERKDAVPNPLVGHPFFEDSKARFVPSQHPIAEVIPELDAVMEHGVPVTKDPYVQGAHFLKIYDVALSAIPWELWKRRFPPAEIVESTPPRTEIEIANPKVVAPSNKLLEEYGTTYSPGLSPRLWLENQVDGGFLVIKMLLSDAASAGVMAAFSGSELGRYAEVPLDKCGLEGLGFDQFLLQGSVRQYDVLDSKKKWIGNRYECIPLEIVKEERKQVGYGNRLKWEDSTSSKIIEDYRRILAKYKLPVVKAKPFSGPKAPVRQPSQLRQKVLSILSDSKREDEDKLRAINVLLEAALHHSFHWNDPEGLFVCCDHTLQLLTPERDSPRFYRRWTRDGVCTECGEVVTTNLLVNQMGFDDQGRALRHNDILDTSVYEGGGAMEFAMNLEEIKTRCGINMADPVDSSFYLMLSLLQVLPSPIYVDQILAKVRLARGLPKASPTTMGFAGIAGVVLLLQIHIPALVPRRSFGPKPLKLTGFPRDAEPGEKDYNLADGLIGVFRKTFEAFPTSFQGPSTDVMRAILNNPKTAKSVLVMNVKTFANMKGIVEKLAEARAYVQLAPPPPEPLPPVPNLVPPTPEQFGTQTSFPACPSTRMSWISEVTPRIGQAPILLGKIVVPESVDRVDPTLAGDTIAITIIENKTAVGARLKLKPSKVLMTDSWKTNLLILNRLAVALRVPNPVRKIDTTVGDDLLRDITQGYLKEMFSKMTEAQMTAFEKIAKRDITLYAITKNYTDAKKESNTLRAKERNQITQTLREMPDDQRQNYKDMMDRGMVPFMLITKEDRSKYAKELAVQLGEEEAEVNPEVGVGQAVGPENEEEGADNGDYGDFQAVGNREAEQDFEPVDEDGPI